MNDERALAIFALTLASALARDLDAAGLLSGATRKALHDGLARHRDLLGGSHADETEADASLRAALRVLDGIPPAADG